MKKQNQPIHPQMKQPPVWRKATASVLTWVIPMQLAFPAYANIQLTRDVNKLQSALDSSARYQLASRVSEHLYEEVFMSPLADIFDGFGYFYQLAASKHPKQFNGMKWVPIGVGDITTMIPVAPQKPLFIGTPYVERDIVRLQLNQLLNRSYIVGEGEYENYNDMIKSLYDNALTLMQEKGYKFGQNLTSAQINSISSDVIWPEFRTLPTGKKVVIPFVYLSKTTIATNKVDKTTFSVGNGVINAGSFTVNGGEVLARRNLFIQTKQDFINYQGNIKAQENLKIQAGNNIENYSGTIQGRDTKLIANAIKNETLVFRHDYEYGFSELAGNLAKITGLNSLNLSTAGDVISKGGQFDSQGTLQINAGGSVQLLTQQVRQQHAQSGKKWTDSSQSLVNLQTKLSAVDMISIVANEKIITQGAIIESEGMLELLAGEGIYLTAAQDEFSWSKSFESKSGGIFGSKEKTAESEQRAEVVRTLLRAGNDITLHTEVGPVTLRAVEVDSQGVTKIIADNIDFDLELADHVYSYEESYEGSLSFRFQGNGFKKQIAYYNLFRTQGGLMLDARHGIKVEFPTYPNQPFVDLDSYIDHMADSDGMSWLKQVKDSPDVNWQEVKLILDEWDYDQSGLSPAAMAILAVAVAVATGGAGVAGLMGVTNTVMAAAVNSLAFQASASLLANGFDIKSTLDQMASSETLKSVALAAATAGILEQLDTSLFNDVSSAASDAIGNGMLGTIAEQASQQVFHTIVASQLESLASGDGLRSLKDIDETVIYAIASSTVNVLGKSLANQIGEASRGIKVDESGKVIETGIDPISTGAKYIAHAALGCGLGSITNSIQGANRKEALSGCMSGAAGGVIGEYIAEKYKEDIGYKEQIDNLQGSTEAFATKVLTQMQEEGGQISKAEFDKEIARLQKMGVDISRLVSGLMIFAAQGDVEAGMKAAGNAAENNAAFLLWLLADSLYTAAIAASAYLAIMELPDLLKSATDVYDLLKSNNPEDRKKATEELKRIAYDNAVNSIEEGAVDKAKHMLGWKKTIAAMTTLQVLELLNGQYSEIGAAEGVEQLTDLLRMVKNDKHLMEKLSHDAPRSGFGSGGDPNHSGGNKKPNKPVEQLTDTDIKDLYQAHIDSVGKVTISPSKFEFYVRNGWEFEHGRGWHKPESGNTTKVSPVFKDDTVNGYDTSKPMNPVDACRFPNCEGELKATYHVDGQTKELTVTQLGEMRQKAKATKEANKHQETPAQQEAFVDASIEMSNLSHTIGKLAGEAMIQNQLFVEGQNGVKRVRKLQASYPGSKKANDQFDDIYLIEHDDGSERLIFAEYKGGSNPSDNCRVIGSNCYVQGHKEHTLDTIKAMKKWNEGANRHSNTVDPNELVLHNETLKKITQHTDRKPPTASFIKITTKLNSDGSLKANGITVDYKEDAFE
ncbi:DUF637 domain-containing protein [Photobacterium sp. 1_MG-2023]|uniref:DUF637 domain-containing protein n=1 Tax=Photobacterium sp. 1_MG-2023 TaxID=3062646 RepID=UPI0026E328B8|nr:DUF637 domain-containing protein [Photobacterium sp. 1_MG-2023]MDO6706669.1 DUF637 domain-containing protein [Photobacterium sp. 1_MG-2023]